MTRLIDADALKKTIKDYYGETLTALSPKEFAEFVDDAPTIEPSGDLISRAEAIVIRSKTLMPTNDFKEWAKRVKEENPNVIVIPCDAEVAERVVRCKDCIYSEEFAKDNSHLVTCEHGVIGGYGEVWEDTNYCSFGERKNENCKPETVQCEECIYAEETWTEYHEDCIECTQYNAIIRRGGYCLYGKRKGGAE